MPKIGLIGGSGFYKIELIEDAEEIEINTPFGKPSDKITLGKIDGTEVAFLPRHGKNHQHPPHKVNYRANIFALKQCDVEYLISIGAVGSLKKEIKPCDFVITEQLIDRTNKRANTFFDEGLTVHVSLADPFCKKLSDIACRVVEGKNLRVHRGTYVCIEGPQFSTRAESNLYRSWNADVIGMTLAPEAKLAREAEMCLCGLLTVTDYDCWYKGEDDVNVKNVVENLRKNDKNIANVIKELVSKINYKRDCTCSRALDNAIITSPEIIKGVDYSIIDVLLKRVTK